MNAQQFKRFADAHIDGIFRMGQLALELGEAKGREIWKRDIEDLSDSSALFKHVVRQLMTHQVIRLFQQGACFKIGQHPGWREYGSYSLGHAIRWHIAQQWEDSRRCIETDPNNVANAPIRIAIGHNMRQGFETRAEMEAKLTEEFEANVTVVAHAIGELEDFMPFQMMMVADTESFLSRANEKRDKTVLKRMMNSMKACEPPGGVFPRPPVASEESD